MNKLQEMKILFWMVVEFLFCTVFLLVDVVYFLLVGKPRK